VRNRASGYSQRRRTLIADYFGPVEQELDRREDVAFQAVVAAPVSPRRDRWPTVDEDLLPNSSVVSGHATTQQDYPRWR
jgi:hypothetical protein